MSYDSDGMPVNEEEASYFSTESIPVPLVTVPGRRKFYVVVREDMPAGYQAVQGLHAAVDFVMLYPKEVEKWHTLSNTVIMLGAKDELAIRGLSQEARGYGLKTYLFWEPDVNSFTALALQPSAMAEELVRDLPLLLRKKRFWSSWLR